ncbi:DNA repair protein complementing XP-C cells homolog [Episyrphus balteatus]|uniref:DNA repair protein complementing XP-C cells homolog n=1 Tax=Episyrphus balteatus TaxID=286459 RepID=UPI0024861601|nr:DNA repair protein complementing XP-C cells homolog [Episyrphus balteatus]
MSDEEYQSSSTEEDFSASEDEWKPGKSSSNRRRQASDESDDDDSDFEDDTPNAKRREAKSSSSKTDASTKQSKKRKSTGTSLRTKLFNKYKPPPKTVQRSSTNQSNQGEQKQKQNIAQGEKKATRVVTNKRAVLSDSESSGDDYLVNPDEIDLKSSFFDVKPSTSSNEKNANNVAMETEDVPKFDCNAGMQLSDSEENEDDDDDETESSKDITITNSLKATTATAATKPVDLGYLQDFAKNMEKAKVQYKKHKERSLLQDQAKVDDVSSLLAMGEGTSTAASASTTSTKKTKNPKRQPKKTQASQQMADTDSDLEEVEEDENFDIPNALVDGIQVCVDLPQRQRKDKKAVDAEACLKRQLNRVIKENQVLLHKVGLLCQIYHGLYLNKIANNIYLMPIALKMLPSNNVYPSGQTEIKYFQSMVTWFKSAVKIRDDRKYPQLKVDPLISLGVQMKHRHAVCKRDFLLMFVILLRAMGMQCRLVCNLVPLPLKPPQSALCSLKMNSSTEEKKSNKKKPVVEKDNKVLKKEPLKSPSITPEAREELRRKVESLENEIKEKKKEKMKPKLSFDEELEAQTAVKSTRPTRTAHKPKESKTEDLKRKSHDTSNEPETKRKTKEPPVKSGYFSESSVVKNEDNNVVGFIDNHSKSFDDQKPSISVNSKPTAKQVAKPQPPKASTSRSTRKAKATETKINDKPTSIPDIVVADEKLNLENITNKRNDPTRVTRSRSKSPKAYISPYFLQTKTGKTLQPDAGESDVKRSRSKSHSPSNSAVKSHISTEFLKTKPKAKVQKVQNTEVTQPSPRKTRARAKLTIPQLDGGDDIPKSRSRKKPIKKPSNSDDDFQVPPPSKKSKAVDRVKQIDRRVLSPHISGDDEENESPSKAKNNAINMWVEVYCELEAQWVCIDLFKGKVNCVDTIRKSMASSNLAYVFAYNNDATLKDVTPRYCTQWAAVLRKGRVEQSWLDEAIQTYKSTGRTQRDLTEDMDLRRIHLDKPMPTTISEYKDHPLYALERHLLKFQVLYPPNALTLGFVRGEPVYARECVHTCHSREIWLKEARVVKLGEEPYKIVKARPKWDRLTNSVIKDQPLEIFGYWQTEEYDPPTAENGIVPRNAYGNVELFKECMLPKKTVHLHLPGLNRVCKKLGIDCASAVIGFDFHQGSCHPLYDGFVVCEEFADTVVDAWNKEQEEAERKEQDKYEARVYGNWKKLIKGLLIRERLKLKYNF